MNRTMRTLTLSLAATGAALLLASCTAAAPSTNGVWGDETAPDSPNLTLNEDGTVSGTDGCNRIVGSFTVDGTDITFGNLATTMRFCEGVDTWLSGATTAVVDGNTLLLQNSAGEEIGTLERG